MIDVTWAVRSGKTGNPGEGRSPHPGRAARDEGAAKAAEPGAMLVRMDDNHTPKLAPLLIVRDAARAIAFYVQTLGAKELRRYLHPTKNTIGHADLVLGTTTFSITEEARAWNSDAPPSLGGSPVVLQLRVEEVGAVFEAMCRAGAEVVFPLQEFAGERLGRLRDPFGHLWILSQRLEDLSDEERGRRRGAFKPVAS